MCAIYSSFFGESWKIQSVKDLNFGFQEFWNSDKLLDLDFEGHLTSKVRFKSYLPLVCPSLSFGSGLEPVQYQLHVERINLLDFFLRSPQQASPPGEYFLGSGHPMHSRTLRAREGFAGLPRPAFEFFFWPFWPPFFN